MADKKEKQTAAEAFDAFAQKLNRFISVHGDEEPVLNRPKTESELNQERIKQHEAQFKKDTIEHYKRFMNPFGTLGTTSSQAAEIAADQKNLLAAYNLHKGLQELNKKFGTNETNIQNAELVCPVAQKDRYTLGGEFVYLQCWLLFEQDIKDYVPVLTAPGNSDGYILQFVPKRLHRHDFKEKEIVEIVRMCFYPGKD